MDKVLGWVGMGNFVGNFKVRDYEAKKDFIEQQEFEL